MRLMLIAMLALVAVGCGVPTEQQGPQIQAIVKACYANGAHSARVESDGHQRPV